MQFYKNATIQAPNHYHMINETHATNKQNNQTNNAVKVARKHDNLYFYLQAKGSLQMYIVQCTQYTLYTVVHYS